MAGIGPQRRRVHVEPLEKPRPKELPKPKEKPKREKIPA